MHRGTLHLGLDLGATNVKWAVVSDEAGEWHVEHRGQQPTGAGEGPEAVVERLATIAESACAETTGVVSIGIGVPGLYDAEAGVARFLPNLPGEWAGRPIGEPVSLRTGRPVALVNDARAFGLAELRLGAGRGVATMVGLTLGTGVGGVVAVDGRVHHGHDGTAGEAGHQTIDPDGPACTCGNRGCLEAHACAARIVELCGTAAVEEAVAAARAGDARALDGLERVGRDLGIGIANLIVVLTPDRVVVGGGVAAAGDLLLDPVREEVRRRVHVTDLDRVEIVAARLGTWAGAIGAAIHGAERAAALSPAQGVA